ncbi:MAG: tripartite tricarboxylate transporter substrate binding protein [Betaproteobacteria bacterium]|nr:tripartite tricarboxylate transporter substrate binding protein [Betaproteobacteria bacterium]
MSVRCMCAAIAALLLQVATLSAIAQDYPSRPIRIIVPFPAGGTADIMPRIVGEKLALKWGQAVIVENRAGAAGNIGAEIVYKAEPDGYTLLSAPPPPLVINASLYPKLAFDPSLFVPVSVIAAVPNVFLVHPKVPASTMQELIAHARANPDKLNYASQGSGSTSHLTAEMFKSMAGVRLTHVPYKGTAPALTDLLAGQVDIMFDNLGSSLQHVRSGKLRSLGIASERRIASLPDVPAIAEVLPGFVALAWFGVVAPPKTPLAIAAKLSAAIAEALRLPEVQKRMAELSAEPVGNTPAEMAAFMKQDAERWRAVIRSANVKVD